MKCVCGRIENASCTERFTLYSVRCTRTAYIRLVHFNANICKMQIFQIRFSSGFQEENFWPENIATTGKNAFNRPGDELRK